MKKIIIFFSLFLSFNSLAVFSTSYNALAEFETACRSYTRSDNFGIYPSVFFTSNTLGCQYILLGETRICEFPFINVGLGVCSVNRPPFDDLDIIQDPDEGAVYDPLDINQDGYTSYSTVSDARRECISYETSNGLYAFAELSIITSTSDLLVKCSHVELSQNPCESPFSSNSNGSCTVNMNITDEPVDPNPD
jgi:hypothetical protein